MFNPRKNEYSVLAEVTAHHLANLEWTDVFNFKPHLLEPISDAPNDMQRFLEEHFGLQRNAVIFSKSSKARVSSLAICTIGDVVLVRQADGSLTAAQVWFHASGFADQLMSLVAFWDHVSSDMDRGARCWYERDDNTMLIPTEDIVGPVAFKRDSDNRATTLLGYAHR